MVDRSASRAMINRINAHLRQDGDGFNLADPDAEITETCYQCQGIRAHNDKYFYTQPDGKSAEGEQLYKLRRGWIHWAAISKRGGTNMDSNDRFKLKEHLEHLEGRLAKTERVLISDVAVGDKHKRGDDPELCRTVWSLM